MCRYTLIIILISLLFLGCGIGNPLLPDDSTRQAITNARPEAIYDERYRLWGQWNLYISETHDAVEVVPIRSGEFHVNILKWLEEDGNDCLDILYINNNGDSTIDLGVKIEHPKPGHPEFTGFDVKGIIMFRGSHELPSLDVFPPYPEPFRISWKEVGDPEVLNPDGYTIRWSPWYESGSDLPLLNYWPGKYACGNPSANLNAYLNFYTHTARLMFVHTGIITREYHIWLPDGPVAAGYAVEACWAQPDVIPVTKPLDEFPLSANMEEPYYLRLIVNNDEPITEPVTCCGFNHDDPCSDVRVECLQWPEDDPELGVDILWVQRPEPFPYGTAGYFVPCTISYPDCYQMMNLGLVEPDDGFPDGKYRGFGIAYRGYYTDPPDEKYIRDQVCYTVWDFEVDRE